MGALLLAALALSVGGCASIMPRQGIANPALAQRAVVSGLPGVRVWGDEIPANLEVYIDSNRAHLPRLAQNAKFRDGRPVVETLALSGGGSDGAFGAGVLAGWTARGDRPQFEVVTGVSAGAIIAPFAFLGPRYDRQLEEIWTQYKTNELITTQILPGLLGGNSLADISPLVELVNHYIDPRLLREVAAEYRKGRMLLVGTTNLDAQRQVIWNMGAIAACGHPDALDLFRKVILASAAVPGAFPPVHIEVEAGGRMYEEMHVDGGATHEVFVTPMQVPFKTFDRLYPAPPIRQIYIIKNGKLGPETQVVTPQTIPIAARAISTLLKMQHHADIYRIYRMAKDAGADFNLTSVPDSFSVKAKDFVDPEYQRALFNEGFRIGRAGGKWLKRPPVQRMVSAQH